MSAPVMMPDVQANSTCDGLTFTDNTTYLGTSITSAQVATATIRLDYSTLGTYIQYVFTVSSNVITAGTLSLAGATPVSITPYIDNHTISNVFPFVDFDLSGDYGVTIPAVEDGVFYTEYRVQGTAMGAPFSYSGTQQIEITCEISCCIAKMFQELSADCVCDDAKWMTAMRAQAYLWASKFATQIGNTENATAALNVANSICTNGCGCS